MMDSAYCGLNPYFKIKKSVALIGHIGTTRRKGDLI